MPTAPSDATPVKQALAFVALEKGVLDGLRDLKKSLDEGALRDVEKIESVTDGHGRGGVPSIPTGAPMTMRGGAAATEDGKHNLSPAPQSGNVADYEALSRQMSDIGKAHDSLVSRIEALGKADTALASTLTTLVTVLEGAGKPVAKANEDEKKDDEVEKALRKARIAVRKAEDEDEEEDSVEKARAAVKAADAAVSKAEDDADDEDKEKAAEKARGALKTLRTTLKGAAEKRAAAKGASPAPADAAPSAADIDAQVRKAMEPIANALGRKVDDLMSAVQGVSRASATPPEFAKAVQGSSVSDVSERIDDLADEGSLELHEISKAKSVLGRLAAAQRGQGDLAAVTAEVNLLPDSIKGLFLTAAA